VLTSFCLFGRNSDKTIVKAATEDFSGGSGTSSDSYIIATVRDLYNVRYQMNEHFVQVNDVDLLDAHSFSHRFIK
jgi:hypothetical protein